MPERAQQKERVFRGIAVSAGVCRGKVLLLAAASDVTVPQYSVPDDGVAHEIYRFEQALAQTRQQILDVQRKVTEGMGAEHASIFEAHLLVLEDPMLIEEVTRHIHKNKVNVEHAFREVAEKYARTLSAMPDDYLRERAADMRDVSVRIINNLLGRQETVDLQHLTEPCIIISHDLAPSVTAQLDKKMVLGFATDIGGKTSHTAIMARSLEIPAVVGLKNISQKLKGGQEVLIDGFNGLVILNPTEQTLYEYGQVQRQRLTFEDRLREMKDLPAVTSDGVSVVLSANVEQAADTESVQAVGAQGVGLFRTEYLFINRELLPTEEEQFTAYQQVAATLQPHPVIIRTLDLGGDKYLPHLNIPEEMNPFLGWRAIRYCLQERDLFRTQLRAILRASVEGNIRLMYPMISGLDELVQANAFLDECRAELRKEGVAFNENLEVGAMIEIPSAVMVADALARHVKFFSIGTNDLIQYTLAVDRLNERIAHLYEPTHPAIVRLIKLTVDAAHRNGIWAGVCGEMAGDPALTPLLLGLGVDELSATPSLVPQVKYLLRALNMAEARELAASALNCDSATEIFTRSRELAKKVAPALFENNNPAP
ncbi:MAG: phosphoenolpyruvate--protein phosphotransferase [Verrucomicrobia bacterium]|nr:phosphoenolpyruvate--protein phosphotransferase [Verrucomicrobiota bacterium]